MKRRRSIVLTKSGNVIFTIFASLLILANVFLGQECQAQETQNAKKYKKILVLAKVQEPDAERDFENSMVRALKDKGYNAIPSYSSFTQSEIENTTRLVEKADSLQIDALLAFSLTNIETTVTNTPQVSANVGIPVRIGFFSVFVGSSIPLAGGTSEKKTVHVKAAFYTDRNSPEPSWSMNLSGNLADGNEALIYDFVKKTMKAMLKQKVL